MTLRLLLPAALLLGLALPALAQKPSDKPPAKPADQKPASASEKAPSSLAAVDKRLAEMEQHLAGLLKEIQALRREVQSFSPKGEKRDEVRVFRLKNANAAELAKTLQGLLQGKDAQMLKIQPDPSTNSVLVAGTPDLLELVEAIITKIDVPKTGPKDGGAKTGDWKEKLKQLETELEMWLERGQWAERMSKNGFLSPSELQANLKKVEEARELLKKAQDEFRKLTGDGKKPSDDGGTKK